MKNLSLLIFVLTLFILSCSDDCTFRSCSPPDFDKINALTFRFDLNATYDESDIENAYIIAFVKGSRFGQSVDTFSFAPQFANGNYDMVLSDVEPFSTGGFINVFSYEEYDYVIRPNDNGKQYKVTNVQVQGQFEDCDCEYLNTEKTFLLDSLPIDRTNSNLHITLN
jgi:hypothetical protein